MNIGLKERLKKLLFVTTILLAFVIAPLSAMIVVLIQIRIFFGDFVMISTIIIFGILTIWLTVHYESHIDGGVKKFAEIIHLKEVKKDD